MKINWIRKKREENKISQYKMARAIGVSSQVLSSWELGKTIPSTKEIEIVENFFKDPAHFFAKNGISKNKKRFKILEENKQNKKEKMAPNNLIDFFYKKNPVPNKKVNGNLKAIMLFSGIGGMSQGFQEAGFNIIGHVEYDESAHRIYKQNFSESVCLGKDIRSVTNDQLKKIKSEYGEISVIAGGPPCQGFSLAGKRNVLDPRNELFQEFARFASILKPKAVLLENVRTLLNMQAKDGKLIRDYLIKAFDDAGYTLVYKPINAKNFGVPQSRERVIFIGLRKDIAKKVSLSFPDYTHSDTQNNKKPLNTFKTATKDLELLESGESSKNDPWHFAISHPKHVIDMLKVVPEGKSAHENKNPNLRPSSGYNTTYKRICWNEPSSTISTNFSMISGSRNVHPQNTRSITIREAMRCQTFPDYFRLIGSLGDIRRGIGNAVPPRLANFLANHIKNYLDSSSK